MSSLHIQTLMERLRIQSILQRLIRAQGREAALDVVLKAIALEFPEHISKTHENRQARQTRDLEKAPTPSRL
jgi:hypothetical protein